MKCIILESCQFEALAAYLQIIAQFDVKKSCNSWCLKNVYYICIVLFVRMVIHSNTKYKNSLAVEMQSANLKNQQSDQCM